MFRTTRTVTSRIISCIIIAGLLVAYYIPYYPSVDDRWVVTDVDHHVSPNLSASLSGLSYRLIRPTSRFILCDDNVCDDIESLYGVFSGGIFSRLPGQEESSLTLSITGYGHIRFSDFAVGEQGRSLSLMTSSRSGRVFVPGSIVVGDGVLSFLSSGYIDMRWLGMSSSFFDNPYQQVLIDRRFISQ